MNVSIDHFSTLGQIQNLVRVARSNLKNDPDIILCIALRNIDFDVFFSKSEVGYTFTNVGYVYTDIYDILKHKTYVFCHRTISRKGLAN